MAYEIIVDKAHQRQMTEAFFEQLHERCRPNGHTALPMVVGLESEYMLIDEQGQLIDEVLRNQILAELPDGSAELGACSIETHTEPIVIAGGDYNLLHEARRVEQQANRVAAQHGTRLVRIGTYPGSFADLRVTQEPPRYQNLLDISHRMLAIDGVLSPVQVGAVTLPTLRCETMCGCQSIHLNVQIPAGGMAIQMLNKAIELVPYLVALGAHSALLNALPTGMDETRSAIWEPLFTFPEFDARYGFNNNRVGFPAQYYTDWDDYWQDVGSKFFIEQHTEKAFESNMKTFWRTVRLKPCPGRVNDCLLELRAFSPQPTTEEDVALFLVCTGLLHDLAWLEQPLLPMHLVEENQWRASTYGLDTALYARDDNGTVVQRPAPRLQASCWTRRPTSGGGVPPTRWA
ncbi:MAG: hypothetical protein HC876_12715 [Chloroflexaceae bacterium]|nr:hypothetical protein [Chloroflexaceae bacterium]